MIPTNVNSHLFSGKDAKYCDECVCMHCLFVCLSVCLSVRLHGSKTVVQTSQIFCTCYLWPWHDRPVTTVVISYVLPVLWMTTCFPMMGHVARSVGNIDVGAVLK